MVNKITSYQTAENGKFVEIVGNTQYPAISVTRWSYPDTSNAFPENAGLPPVSSVDVYAKYAVLVEPIGIMAQLTTITNVLCAILAKP
jgi:hypothetical protein